MVGIAGVVVWLGYAVFAFGWSQVRSCNAGFLAMISPFGAQPTCNPDPPATNVAPTGTQNVGSAGTTTTVGGTHPGTKATITKKAVNQYSSKAAAEAAGTSIGGQFAVVHNPNGSWSVLAP